MGWIKSFKNKSGGYDSFDWSILLEFKISAASALALILGLSIVMLLGPAVCVLMYPFPGTRKSGKQMLILGIFLTIFWVLDYMFGLYNWIIWSEMISIYDWVTSVNLILAFYCLLTYIFEDLIYESFIMSNSPFLWYYGGAIAIVYLSMDTVLPIVSNNIDIASKLIYN